MRQYFFPISVTFPWLVAMVNAPLALADILPTWTPGFLRPDGTLARTISPVRKSCKNFFCLGLVRGKPNLFIKQSCLHPCPLAVIASGTICLIWSSSGVLLPTQQASNQCVLGKPRCVRLNFVKPPLPHSTGNPNAFSR